MKEIPKRLHTIYLVVRDDPAPAPLYAPKSSEVRSKKFYSLKEATKLYKQHKAFGRPVRLYEAQVNEWEEIILND